MGEEKHEFYFALLDENGEVDKETITPLGELEIASSEELISNIRSDH